MSYSRVTWANGATALSAEHMNNIEDGINEALDGLGNVYTKAEADAKYRTITDSYTKSDVYTKTESDDKYRTKADSYTKSESDTRYKKNADFVVLTYNKTMTARQDYTEYTEDISNVVDDADNYAIMGVSAKVAGTSTADEINKWVNYYGLNSASGGYLTNHKQMPTVKLYNDSGTRKVKFGLISMSNTQSTVTIRIVLMKVA